MMRFNELSTARKLTVVLGSVMFFAALFLELFVHSVPAEQMVRVEILGIALHILAKLEKHEKVENTEICFA